MIPILAASLTGLTCLIIARLFRAGEWAVWTAAALAALAAMALPDLRGVGMSNQAMLLSELSRAATAAFGGTLLGSVAIAISWVMRYGAAR